MVNSGYAITFCPMSSHDPTRQLYGVEYFVTTDNPLINRANNEGKGVLKIKVVSPFELLEIIRPGPR